MKTVKAWALLERDEDNGYEILGKLAQVADNNYQIFSSYKAATRACYGLSTIVQVEIRELKPKRRKAK